MQFPRNHSTGWGEPLDRTSLSSCGYHFKNQNRCETGDAPEGLRFWKSPLEILMHVSKQQGVNESCFLSSIYLFQPKSELLGNMQHFLYVNSLLYSFRHFELVS